MQLVEFILQRIDEDEAVARQAVDALVCGYPDYQTHVTTDTQRADRHVERFGPTRVLAECAAKRAILDLHAPSTDHGSGYDPYCTGCWDEGGQDGAPIYPCRTVRILVPIYSDHPDYDEAWRP
jgi:Family of unknown function (DUF6221)